MNRSLRVTVGCCLLALGLGPIASSFGQSAGTATADKEGWWSQTGRVGPAAPPETVPEGAIGIAAAGGEAIKVAAIGIVLDAEKGSTVDTFTLTMTEAEGTGANQNAGGAAIVACPVIDFFAPDVNGAWEDAPEADCEAATADGTRNDDGTWTFDLVPLANLWLDPFGTVSANGVRFDPGGGTFQVSLTGMEDAVFDVSLTPPQEDADPFDTATTTVPGGFTGGAPPSSSGGDFATEPPPSIDAPTTGDGRTATTVADAPTDDDDVAAAEPAVSRAGDTGGNLPGGVPLLVVLMLAGAALVALGLGPAGRQRATTARHAGGVSRALDSRIGARS